MDAERHIHELKTRGFSVFGKLWTDEECDYLRQVVIAEVEKRKPGALWSELAEDTEYGRNPAGLAHYRLLSEQPHLTERMIKPEVIEVLRGALGEDMRMEMGSSMISDQDRPYVGWHCHLDGAGDSRYRRWGWPVMPGLRRLQALVYLDDIDDESGPLLLYPRGATDSVAPAGPMDAEDWEGQVVVRVPRGTLVVFSEATWHAARPMRRTGYRAFMVSYFRARGAPPSRFADPNLHIIRDRSPLAAELVTPPEGDPVDPRWEVRIPKFPEAEVKRLSEAIAVARPGWRLTNVLRETKEVRFDVEHPEGMVRIVAYVFIEGMEVFQVTDGLAYDVRGERIDERAEAIAEIIGLLHPIVDSLLGLPIPQPSWS